MTENASTSTTSQPSSRPWCFGRFAIDLPMSAYIDGGHYEYNFAKIQNPEELTFDQYEHRAEQREAKLRAQKHEKDPSLLREIRRVDKSTRVLSYWEEFGSAYVVEIEGDKWVSGRQFSLKARASQNRQASATNVMVDRLSRLRARNDDEMPTTPGFCFPGGFIADDVWQKEIAGVDFSFRDIPGATLAIDLPGGAPGPTLLEREGGVLKALGQMASNVQTLRRGKRAIGPFQGEEWLVAAPAADGSRSYMFVWETQGEESIERPIIHVRFSTGGKRPDGTVSPSGLTQDAALKLWDRMIETLRIRPVGAAKTSLNEPTSPNSPATPLGELAATGRACPQTGWWQCADEGNIVGGRRQFFRAGEVMPKVVFEGEPSVWQKLKGERPTHRMATVWKLVGYDETAGSTVAPSLPGSASGPENA